MQLSHKKKISEFFFAFSEYILIFKHFPEKDDPHS